MADQNLELIIKARDEASAAVQKVNDSLKGVTDTANKTTSAASNTGLSFGKLVGAVGLGSLAANAAMSAFSGLNSFLSGTVAAAAEAERGQAQLAAVLASTGGAAGVTASMANQLASSLSGLTTFTDDEVLSAENLLLTFTNISSTVFPDAVKSILDVATAMGGDTKGAAIQLGKALNNPIEGISALTRVGVTFTDQQKKQITTLTENGKVMEAQKIVLSELNKEFGGSAAAAAQTYDGRLKQLKNTFGEIQENIGKALLPGLEALISGMNGSAQAAQNNTEAYNVLGKAFYAAIMWLKGMGQWIYATSAVLGGFALTIFDTGKLVFAFAKDIAKHMQSVKSAFVVVFSAIAKAIHGDFQGAWDGLKTDIMEGFDMSNTQAAFANFGSSSKGIMEVATDAWNQGSADMGEAWLKLSYKPIAEASDQLGKKIPTDLGAMGEGAKKAAEKFKGLADSFKESMLKVGESLADLTKDFIKKSTDALESYEAKVADINKSMVDENVAHANETLAAEKENKAAIVDLYIKTNDKITSLLEEQKKIEKSIAEKSGPNEELTKQKEGVAAELLKQNAQIAAIKAQAGNIEEQATAALAKTDLDKLNEKFATEKATRDTEHTEKIAELQVKMEEEKAVYEKNKQELIAETIDKYEKIGAELNKGWEKMKTDTKGHVAEMKALEAQVLAIQAAISSARASVGAGGMPSSPTPVKGKADGGFVSGNTPYIVGERGPELFVPGRSGSIVPNGGGSMNISIMAGASVSIRSQSDIDSLASAVASKLAQAMSGVGNGLASTM